jgi:PAS domain-containing protein
MLEELGLVPALQALAALFARRTGIACEVDAPPELDHALAHRPLLATCLYRVTQEALNNAAKHSHATEVSVQLAIVAGMQVSLAIVDNGRGFTARDRHKAESFGILGMNERVRSQGGNLRVENLAAGGTRLEVIAPLADGEDDALPAVADSGRGEDPAGPDSGFAPPFRDSAGAALDLAPLPRLLSRTTGHALQAVIDAMPGNVAILDSRGLVRFVNRAWHAFAEHNGNPGSRATGPGVDYLEVCRRSARDDPTALPVVLGLEALIASRVAEYVHDYPCHTPDLLQWFRLHAAPIANGDILVTHFLVAVEPGAREQARR